MRIVFFPSSYTPVVGGMQIVVHNLARQLLTRGHEVRVITNRYPVALPARENSNGVLIERLLLLTPKMAQLRNGRPDLLVASLYFQPQNYRRLSKIFKEYRPDVVNVHFPDHQIDAVLRLRNRFKFRLVVSLHGDDVERFTGGGSRGDLPRFRAILNAADAVTTVSRDLLDKATTIEPTIDRKSHVIHNGIDVQRFAEKSCHYHPRPYLLAVGRLVHKKGFDLLIEAFARCEAANRSDLIIAGSGEERGALERQVEQLGLLGRIHFFGDASPEEVVKLMNGSLAVVVASRQEPFGLVALEAIAAGKPIVATSVGGLEEFLNNFRGLQNGDKPESDRNGDNIRLVEPTVAGIADGLISIASSYQSKGNGRDKLLPEFSWQKVTERYERVLLGRLP